MIEVSVAAVTFRMKLFELMPPCAALTLEDPTALPVASPVALMVAVALFEDVQITEVVRSCVLLSLNVPVAKN